MGALNGKSTGKSTSHHSDPFHFQRIFRYSGASTTSKYVRNMGTRKVSDGDVVDGGDVSTTMHGDSSGLTSKALIRVFVKQGRQLPKADFRSESDPYTVAYFSGSVTSFPGERKTHHIEDNNAPVWNFGMYFIITEHTTDLNLQVFDWDRASKDDLLGSTVIPRSQWNEYVKHTWISLDPSAAFPLAKPEIQIGIDIVDFKEIEFKYLLEIRRKQLVIANLALNLPLKLFSITIHSAMGLISADADGSSDPYAIVGLDEHRVKGSMSVIPPMRTKTMNGTLDPVWEESWVAFITRAKHLSLEIWDADLLNADDCIGKLKLSIISIANKGRIKMKLYPQGSVEISCNCVPCRGII